MIDTLLLLLATFVLIFLITFFYLSKDIFKTGIVKIKKAKIRYKEPWYILMMAWLITVAIIIGEFVKMQPAISFWTFVGAGIVLAGGTLRIISKKQLHRFYSFHVVIQNDHKIVKKGPYASIRHPLMAGMLLMVLGYIGMAQSIYGGLLFLVALLPAAVYYTSQEEKALMEEFEHEYLTYMKQTKKFIPGVW